VEVEEGDFVALRTGEHLPAAGRHPATALGGRIPHLDVCLQHPLGHR
jgi:hypothetical protein